MNTRNKRIAKRVDAQESDRNQHHPSEEELQNWTLLPDAVAGEESERIKRHVDSCELCKVYCELVLAAEKDVEAYLQTETGRNRRRKLLNRIASECAIDRPCPVASGGAVPTSMPLIDPPAKEPPQSSGVAGDTATKKPRIPAPSILHASTAESRPDPRQSREAVADVDSAQLPQRTYDTREQFFRRDKEAIGWGVADLLERFYLGQGIGVDGGTTNATIARVLGFHAANGQSRRRVLVTNHAEIPRLLGERLELIEVHGVGGEYRHDLGTFIGDHAIVSLKRFRLAVSLLGINGYDSPLLLTSSGKEDGVKKAFMRSSRDLIFAFDSSKWGFRSGSTLATLRDLFEDYDCLLGDADGRSICPEERTIYLVTTFPVVDENAARKDIAEASQLQENFLAGVARLATDEWTQSGASVQGAIVAFPEEGTDPPTVRWMKPRPLDGLPTYFEDIATKNGLNQQPRLVLVVAFKLTAGSPYRKRSFSRQSSLVEESLSTQVPAQNR